MDHCSEVSFSMVYIMNHTIVFFRDEQSITELYTMQYSIVYIVVQVQYGIQCRTVNCISESMHGTSHSFTTDHLHHAKTPQYQAVQYSAELYGAVYFKAV